MNKKDRERLHRNFVYLGLIIVIVLTYAIADRMNYIVEGYVGSFDTTTRYIERPSSEPRAIIDGIVRRWERHGTGEVIKAINCFYSESGLNPNAVNYNTNGTTDKGIAQINSIHNLRNSYDIDANLDKAYQLYLERGFKPWYGSACK